LTNTLGVDSQKRFVPAPAPSDRHPAAEGPIKTALLVGLPRSGTTLLGSLLSGVENSLSLSEPFLAHAIYPHWRLRRFFVAIQKSASLRRLPVPRRCSVDELLSYCQRLAAENGLGHLIIKETYRVGGEWDNVAILDQLLRSPVSTVAISRHPYDIAVSSIKFCRWWRGLVGHVLRLFAPGLPLFANDREIVEYCVRNWVSFTDWCGQRQLLVVRYEDLVREPAEQLRRVCDQLSVPFDARMTSPKHPRGAFGGIGDPGVMKRPSKPVNTRSIGRKANLPDEFRDIIVAACADRMSSMNYEV